MTTTWAIMSTPPTLPPSPALPPFSPLSRASLTPDVPHSLPPPPNSCTDVGAFIRRAAWNCALRQGLCVFGLYAAFRGRYGLSSLLQGPHASAGVRSDDHARLGFTVGPSLATKPG